MDSLNIGYMWIRGTYNTCGFVEDRIHVDSWNIGYTCGFVEHRIHGDSWNYRIHAGFVKHRINVICNFLNGVEYHLFEYKNLSWFGKITKPLK